MKKITLFFVLISMFSYHFMEAQTPGIIYKPAGNSLGKAVLDNNGDGYVSAGSAGFVTNDDAGESELAMIPLPSMKNEPVNDLNTGAGGGHTDMVSNSSGNSVYVLVKTVDGIDYLIIRFRLGSASTAAKGYSLLLDTDGVFGNYYTPSNPGIEKEIVLETGNRVAIYTHDASGVTLSHSYNINNYHQRSVAFSTVSGNPDYFYDFFVPLSAINTTSQVRMVGATITSAQSSISGTISDFHGIDDKAYGNNKLVLFPTLIENFPPVYLDDLRDGFVFPLIKTTTPTITANLTTASNSIFGVSSEANGTVIQLFKNGVSIGTATVTNNNWSLTGVSGLVAGDLITASAQAAGKSVSDLSAAKEVSQVQSCFIPRPVIGTYQNGQTVVNGTWSNGNPIAVNTIQIKIFIANTAINPHGFTEIFQAGNTPVFVATNGSWTFNTQYNQSAFSNNTFFAIAVSASCTSDYSNPLIINNGTLTNAPSLLTTPLYANTGTTAIQVRNNHTANATLYLYVNGVQQAVSPAAITANAIHTFTINGLISGDVVYAKAIGTLTTNRLSAASNQVTVLDSNIPSAAPVIAGSYIAGANQTVSGSSSELPGTIIRLFSNGTLIGTTVVTAFNTWTIQNVTLISGAVLTATAKADGKTTSPASNSITVAAAATPVPAISGNYVVGNTTITGTGGQGTITVYIDGSPIGTTISGGGGNWSLTVSSTELYRGAVITATNTVSGNHSAFSNGSIVTGVVKFCITDENGNPITDKNSGETFTIRITAIDGPTCPGNVFTGFQGKVVLYANRWMQPSGETANFVNGVLIMQVAVGGIGEATIEVVNPNDPTAFGSSDLNIINPAIWVGTNGTDFNTASNWFYNYVPAPGASIRFHENAVNHCFLDTERILGGIDFNSSSQKLNLNGNNLVLRGSITNSNTVTGSFISDATSAMAVYGSLENVNLYFEADSGLGELYVSKTSGGSVELGLPLAIYTLLDVDNGTFNTNGLLTLKSISVANTAQVAPVSGDIIGDVTVERYIPARRAFRFISSPVTTTTPIRDHWQEGVNNINTTTNLNPVPGYGTHITGSLTGQNGFDATPSGNPSLYMFNNATQQWNVAANTNSTTLTSGAAYRLLVRGDRSVDITNNSTVPTNTILRNTGTLMLGDFSTTSLSTVADAFNFIGNPYQAAVDMGAVLAGTTGLSDRYIYVWDPTLGGTPVPGQPGGRGAFVTIDVLDNTNNNGGSAANKYLQPGQAAFIQSTGGAASLSFREHYKAIDQLLTTVFSVESKIDLLLFDTTSFQNEDTPADGLSIRFAENNTNAITQRDAPKFYNQDENLATQTDGGLYSIEHRAMPVVGEGISLFNNQYRRTNYIFEAKLTEINDVVAFLKDHYTGISTELQNNTSTLYTFQVDATIPASTANDRFEIVFEEMTLGEGETVFGDGFVLFPNPAQGEINIGTRGISGDEVQLNITGILGQTIYNKVHKVNSNGLVTLDVTGLANGVYLVKLTASNGGQFTAKFIKK